MLVKINIIEPRAKSDGLYSFIICTETFEQMFDIDFTMSSYLNLNLDITF